MKRIIVFLIVLPIIYVNFFSEKARLDREVKRLCAIDGGITVYEMVKLPKERFTKYGSIYIPVNRLAKPEDEYYYDYFKSYLKNGNPDMWRSHFKVYRRSDQELLGEAISYTRQGGDIPGPWHHTWFRCPKDADIVDLNKQIFIKE